MRAWELHSEQHTLYSWRAACCSQQMVPSACFHTSSSPAAENEPQRGGYHVPERFLIANQGPQITIMEKLKTWSKPACHSSGLQIRPFYTALHIYLSHAAPLIL